MTAVSTQIAINSAQWTSLGAGPMQVVISQYGWGAFIHLREQDAMPALGAQAHVEMSATDPRHEFSDANNVWAIVSTPGQTAILDVTTGIVPAGDGGSGGGGGAGGAVTMADGSNVTQGATTDAAGALTIMGQIKAAASSLAAILAKLITGVPVTGAFWPATQPVSGAVTANIGATNGVALDASLQAILAALTAQIDISGSLWADPTQNPVVYYVRREAIAEATGVVTVSWWTPGGAAAAPTVANLVSVSNAKNIAQETVIYTASAAGTGYAAGDILIHAFGIDTAAAAPALAYSLWMSAGPSVASGTILAAAPTSGTFAQAVQQVQDSTVAAAIAAAALTPPVQMRAQSIQVADRTSITPITATGADTALVLDSGSTFSAEINIQSISGSGAYIQPILTESVDGGATFVDIWHLPRLTAAGKYKVPHMSFYGQRQWRYIVGGSSPSVVMTINSTRGSGYAPILRQFFDYTGLTSGNTAGATSMAYEMSGCKSITVSAFNGSSSTPAVLQAQGSPNGVDFVYIGSSFAPGNNALALSTTTTLTNWVRCGVLTAGAAETINYVHILGNG